jgi:hypothetical protein
VLILLLSLRLAIEMFATFAAWAILRRSGGHYGSDEHQRNKPTPKIKHGRFPGNWRRARSFELDVAFDFERKTDAFDRQRHFCRQCFVAFQPAAGNSLAHRLFDFTLRGDADLFEKFTQTDVEHFLVHDRLLKAPERWLLLLYRVCAA